MSEYFVTKREKCSCGGVRMKSESLCDVCDGLGFVDEDVNLLEVLAKVRWMATDEGLGFIPSEHKFKELRIEE